MANIVGLAHLGIYTNDIEKSKDFYINKLGFTLDFETNIDKGSGNYLKISFVKAGNLCLELLQHSDPSITQTGNNAATEHFAIRVQDIEQCVSEYKSKGIVFETEEPVLISKLYDSVKAIFFRGPSGERVELFEFLN